MNVGEIKKAIADLPDDMEAILQKDSEGNGYCTLSGVDPDAIYVPDTPYSGDVYGTNDSASDHCMDEEDWEEMKKGPRALILYP